MKHLLYIFLCLLIVFLSESFLNQTQIETIIWSKDKSLTWNDFKAQPLTNSSFHAITNSGIYKSYKRKNDSLVINIIAEFYPNKSWVNSEKKTNYLLKHEQKHFDIVELHARKLRQTFSLFKFTKNNFQNDINSFYEKNKFEKSRYQILYDSITKHSEIKQKQLEWEKKIEKELKDLDGYSNTEINILLK